MKKIFALTGGLVIFGSLLTGPVNAESSQAVKTEGYSKLETVSDINFERAYTLKVGQKETTTINNVYGDPKVYKVKFPFSGEAAFQISSSDADFNMEIYDENYNQVGFLSDDDTIMQVDGNSWYYLVVSAGTSSSYGYDFTIYTAQ